MFPVVELLWIFFNQIATKYRKLIFCCISVLVATFVSPVWTDWRDNPVILGVVSNTDSEEEHRHLKFSQEIQTQRGTQQQSSYVFLGTQGQRRFNHLSFC